MQPPDCREADAIDGDRAATMVDRDVAPGLQMRRDGRVRFGVVLVEERERAIGEHHAETESRVGCVLFEDADVQVRPTPL